MTQTSLKTRLVEWRRQLKGTTEKLNAKDNTNVDEADLSWACSNNCMPIALNYYWIWWVLQNIVLMI